MRNSIQVLTALMVLAMCSGCMTRKQWDKSEASWQEKQVHTALQNAPPEKQMRILEGWRDRDFVGLGVSVPALLNPNAREIFMQNPVANTLTPLLEVGAYYVVIDTVGGAIRDENKSSSRQAESTPIQDITAKNENNAETDGNLEQTSTVNLIITIN